jgi:hypothetical protein
MLRHAGLSSLLRSGRDLYLHRGPCGIRKLLVLVGRAEELCGGGQIPNPFDLMLSILGRSFERRDMSVARYTDGNDRQRSPGLSAKRWSQLLQYRVRQTQLFPRRLFPGHRAVDEQTGQTMHRRPRQELPRTELVRILVVDGPDETFLQVAGKALSGGEVAGNLRKETRRGLPRVSIRRQAT